LISKINTSGATSDLISDFSNNERSGQNFILRIFGPARCRYLIEMKKSFLLILISTVLILHAPSQVLPDGYILQYSQNFSNNKALGDFWFNHETQWKISKSGDNSSLQLNMIPAADSQISPLPANRCILKNTLFGDFVLEVDVKPVSQGAADADICIFLGLKDSTTYYVVLLSTNPENDLQGIYLVKTSIRKKLPVQLSSTHALTANSWQKIRVERNITSRTICVYAGNMQEPVLQVKDYELVMGRVGLGSLNSPSDFDNITIWAPTKIPEDELN
jgi:hypothetical protein